MKLNFRFLTVDMGGFYSDSVTSTDTPLRIVFCLRIEMWEGVFVIRRI